MIPTIICRRRYIQSVG